MATVINSLRDRADTLATALKNLYVKLGGELTDKPDGTHTVAELVTIPECVDAITSIAEPGGGGSSDFSAAEVTIINQATMSLSNVPATVCYEENDLGDGVPATLFPSIISIPSSQTGSIKCALYKGTSAIMFADYTEFVEISVSGDATYMGGMVAVTGDCTITITEKQ